MTEHLLPEGAKEGTIHASTVAMQGRGLVILGPSSSGKSSLALQLIALGAELIADDATEVFTGPTGPLLSAPTPIKGRIEARGLGLLRLPTAPQATAWAALRLLPSPGPRLPANANIDVAGHLLPLLTAYPAPHLAAALFLCLRTGTLPDLIDP